MKQNLPGGNSAVVPPDPMPNSEVKRRSADGSVGPPHARVGHCQASNKVESLMRKHGAFCCACYPEFGAGMDINTTTRPPLRMALLLYAKVKSCADMLRLKFRCPPGPLQIQVSQLYL